MPELGREVVEHRLSIKKGFRPFKQSARRFEPSIVLKIKDEIENLLKAGFIRPAHYVEWLANIVPVKKKNEKLRICIDFRILNLATPKNEYPMPIIDTLVDAAAGHGILSFMDGHAGYNQIIIGEDDMTKTAFRYPGSIRIFEWLVMSFGLKNVGAAYQRVMNLIFRNLIGKSIEVYINDIVVKSKSKIDYWADLRLDFERMRKYSLEMNPLKCAFGISAGNFLGFLVHQRGIEVDQNKIRAIIEMPTQKTKKELQSL